MFTVNKLRISGFKSFAHSTELLIEDGVTGVIGPNGCGKSNVFEAIRWVMGESSSKSLRSSSMDEVIFNGTQQVPAKNFAEVSIELDNFQGQLPGNITNDKKVIITRTLERGVGSFYKINGKEVRAKDVSILFYDSGSGPRSSSIISQGNIDQIINSKPIDRKIILEDAAGTSGLQSRRHESELKLQATEINLEKIDINLKNLVDQKKDLSRQARQAEKYEQISENIKYYQSIIVFTQWKKNIGEIEELQISRGKISEETQICIKELTKLQNELNFLKKNEVERDQKKEILNKKIFQISNEINKHNSELDGINNKKIEVQRFLNTIKNDKELENSKFIELDKIRNNLQDKISTPSEINKKKKILVELLSQETELKNQLKQLETVFVNEIQLSLGEEFKSDNLKENKENLQKKKTLVRDIINNINKNLTEYKKEFDSQNQLNKEFKLKIQNIQNLLNQKKKTINQASQNNQKLSENIKDLSTEIDICSTKLTQIKTELKTLTLLTSNTGLSSDSILNLLKIKKGYEDAVYAALTNELDATLKNSKKRWIKTHLKEIKPIENNLSNYVDGPKELSLILSQIGLVDDLSQILEEQKDLKIGQSIVDKNGSIWRWDGFISEDNLQKKKLIDAQLKIKELVGEQDKYEVSLEALEIKKNSLLNQQTKNNKIFKDENYQIERIYREYDLAQSKLSSLKQKSSILEFNINDSKKKLNFQLKEEKLLSKELEQIKSIEISTSKFENSKSEKEEVQKNIQNLDLDLDKKRQEITTLKESIMKEELNETFCKNDLQKTIVRINECKKQIQILEKREVEYLSQSKQLDNLPSSIKQKINHFQGLYNEIEKEITRNISTENELKKKIGDIEKTSDDLNKERENKINEITRIDSNLENFKLKEKELRDIIYHRSRIQPEELENDLKEKKVELSNYEDIKIKLDKVITQREQMGPVNLRAKIEEKIITQSIDELEMERLDLSQAIGKLRIAINKINNEGKNRLLKAYEEVNEKFSNLFKKLFNGGEARLELIKSDDPLQTGIEIYARPPGKKLSSISLLSGGEKALTAISLIFSIFLINPSPLCILDEVDAALDENNVEKFCNILFELKKETKTKFMIITHHKITMTSIDRVYGVTMTQKGISDIVSVDFEKTVMKEAV